MQYNFLKNISEFLNLNGSENIKQIKLNIEKDELILHYIENDSISFARGKISTFGCCNTYSNEELACKICNFKKQCIKENNLENNLEFTLN